MTERLALIPLTGAGERYCEECRHLDGNEAPFAPSCQLTGYGLVAVEGRAQRDDECLSAERDAARLRAVEAAARGLHAAKEAWLDAGNRDEQESAGDRLDAAWTALRAALKETP